MLAVEPRFLPDFVSAVVIERKTSGPRVPVTSESCLGTEAGSWKNFPFDRGIFS